jgi:methyl-galactoside transport system substrate-binding protein
MMLPLALACVLAVSLLLPACGSRLSGDDEPVKSIKVGVTIYDEFDTFIGILSERFTTLVRETEQREGITITVQLESANGDQFLQNNQVESFIENECDVICVNLVDRTDATVIIDKAEAADIPVIFFNRELVAEDLERASNLYYVGAPAFESGRMQGDIAADICRADFDKVDKNGDGVLEYVMLEGQAGHQDATLRTEWSVKTLISEGFEVQKLEDEIANWVRSQAETKMTQWLAAYGAAAKSADDKSTDDSAGDSADDSAGEIEIVFSNNDEMALGAIDALKKSDIPRVQWPVVIGIDGTPGGLEAVMAGEMAGTVFNDGFGQSEALLALVRYTTDGTAIPSKFKLESGKYIRIPYQPITKDNASEFMKLYEG